MMQAGEVQPVPSQRSPGAHAPVEHDCETHCWLTQIRLASAPPSQAGVHCVLTQTWLRQANPASQSESPLQMVSPFGHAAMTTPNTAATPMRSSPLARMCANYCTDVAPVLRLHAV